MKELKVDILEIDKAGIRERIKGGGGRYRGSTWEWGDIYKEDLMKK